MKNFRITALLAVMFCLIAPNLQAQIKKQDLANAWDNMTSMFVTTTKSMPAKYFSENPTDEIATFGGLVGHTIGANFLFGPTVDAPKVDRPTFDDSNKEEVVKNLEASFKYIKEAIDQLSDDDFGDEIEWFGSKMTRLKAILTMTDHVEREYGKVITYVRLKGVKPAPGRGW